MKCVHSMDEWIFLQSRFSLSPFYTDWVMEQCTGCKADFVYKTETSYINKFNNLIFIMYEMKCVIFPSNVYNHTWNIRF